MASGLAGSSAVAVVCNPGAGGGRVKREWDELETRLRSVAPRPTILTTRYPGHATALTREALYDGYDRIVSVGGDGTHHEVVNGFFWDGASINPEAALAPLPLGTGSDLVRTIGLSRRGVARLF
ncbi:MAG: acylglycerol kinase family protein, partial [Candidatus Hydrogenedentota bacterium]